MMRSDGGLRNGLRLTLVVAPAFGRVQAGERSGCAGGSNRHLQLGVDNAFFDARDLALNDGAHLLQFGAPRRIVVQEGLRQPYRADRQAHHIVDVPVDGERQLATAAAQIDEQGARIGQTRMGEHAQVNEPALLQTGDDFDVPARCGAHPVDEGAAVAGIA